MSFDFLAGSIERNLPINFLIGEANINFSKTQDDNCVYCIIYIIYFHFLILLFNNSTIASPIAIPTSM